MNRIEILVKLCDMARVSIRSQNDAARPTLQKKFILSLSVRFGHFHFALLCLCMLKFYPKSLNTAGNHHIALNVFKTQNPSVKCSILHTSKLHLWQDEFDFRLNSGIFVFTQNWIIEGDVWEEILQWCKTHLSGIKSTAINIQKLEGRMLDFFQDDEIYTGKFLLYHKRRLAEF